MPEGTNQKSVANTQQQMLAARVELEIQQMILPHLKRQKDCRYPFTSKDELIKEYYRDLMAIKMNLKTIFSAAAQMPSVEGDAFGYIAHREISAIVGAFAELAQSRLQSARNHASAPTTAG